MHASVAAFARSVLDRDTVEGRRILEVGALDVNGSIRPHAMALKPAEYIGTDKRRGRRVDVVVPADRLAQRFAPDSFDVVVCLETLEHVMDWRLAVWNMATVLRMGGELVLTTRSPGFPRHEHPEDWWRFTVEEMRLLFRWWFPKTVTHDPETPGVFVRAVKQAPMTFAQIDYVKAERAPVAAP